MALGKRVCPLQELPTLSRRLYDMVTNAPITGSQGRLSLSCTRFLQPSHTRILPAFEIMALTTPHKAFLINEILEMFLIQTDMQTLLISAQRVCHRWHDLIQDSADLQAALFFKPVRYELPRGILGIRNPLLDKFIWPWFCSKQAQSWGAPKVREIQIPPADPRDNDRFL